jgi:hypothetical protein
MDGWMKGWMECRKTLKLGIIFYMPKQQRRKEKKDENILGIFFLCQKEISRLKEEKNENW